MRARARPRVSSVSERPSICVRARMGPGLGRGRPLFRIPGGGPGRRRVTYWAPYQHPPRGTFASRDCRISLEGLDSLHRLPILAISFPFLRPAARASDSDGQKRTPRSS